MPKAKYVRYLAPPGNEFEMELPEKAYLFAEVVEGVLYISATQQADSPMRRMTVLLSVAGDEFEADHMVDLGLICLPTSQPMRATIISFMSPEEKVRRRIQASGIIGATSLPGH